MDFQSLSQLIKERRAVYPNMYLDRKIPNETILEILENANWAPNHKKTEPWRFKIFTDSSLLKLSKYLSNYYKEHTDPANFSEKKYEKTKSKPLQCSHVIAICMYNDPNISIPEWEEIAAVACAVQNMWLSCTTLDIGCYWSSPKSILNANEFLNLTQNEKCLGLFYMGYKNDTHLPGSRKSIGDKITWI